MTLPVFVVATMPPPGEFVLDGPEGRHAATVRRLRVNAPLILTDGHGHQARATVTGTEKNKLRLEVAEPVFIARPALQVTLIQALPKGERSDLAVELATEAGVDHIVPWQAERCVARWDGSADKAERGRVRWQTTAQTAMKQSRRTWVPTVHPLATLADVTQHITLSDHAFVLHESATTRLAHTAVSRSGTLLLIVGPEGGISDNELTQCVSAGATPILLGPEVLRTSTAGALAIAALGVMTGRW